MSAMMASFATLPSDRRPGNLCARGRRSRSWPSGARQARAGSAKPRSRAAAKAAPRRPAKPAQKAARPSAAAKPRPRRLRPLSGMRRQSEAAAAKTRQPPLEPPRRLAGAGRPARLDGADTFDGRRKAPARRGGLPSASECWRLSARARPRSASARSPAPLRSRPATAGAARHAARDRAVGRRDPRANRRLTGCSAAARGHRRRKLRHRRGRRAARPPRRLAGARAGAGPATRRSGRRSARGRRPRRGAPRQARQRRDRGARHPPARSRRRPGRRHLSPATATAAGWSRPTAEQDRIPRRRARRPPAPTTARSSLAEESAGAPLRACREARVVERLGAAPIPRAISLIAIATHGIPTEFPAAALAEAEAARRCARRARRSARRAAGHDRRHRRARFRRRGLGRARSRPGNAGGWHLVVAIADVAWYVRPGSALDREAERRGNSVYFPDRVVPMLPEALSNELCSLKPAVDRACLAVASLDRRRRPQAPPPLRARADALGRAAHL